MKAKVTTKNTPNTSIQKSLLYVAFGTAMILAIPLIAMQFSSEVDWSAGDFAVMGVLLFGAGALYVFAIRNMRDKNHRRLVGLAIVAAVLYIWAELAVGVFTNLGS